MRAPSLPLLRLGALSLVAAAGVLAAPASAKTVSLDYQCVATGDYLPNPSPGAPLSATVTVDLPTSVGVGQDTGPIPVRVSLEAFARAGYNVYATATASIALEGAGLARRVSDLTAPVSHTVPSGPGEPDTRPAVLAFTADLPSARFSEPGVARASIVGVSLTNLRFSDRVAGMPIVGGPEAFSDCKLTSADADPGLGSIQVTPVGPPPGGPSANDITSTSARICPRPGVRVPIVTRYVVFQGDRKLAESVDPNPCPTVTGLTPNTQYELTLKTGAAGGDDSGLTSEGRVTFTTLPGEQTGTIVDYPYALSGAATLKTLTKGSIPLSGTIEAKLAIATGDFTADLALDKAKANLTALGFLPVTADVALQSTDQVTGTLSGGKLTALAKVRIKLPSVKTFGVELAGGANCQAKQVSAITLTSTQEKFFPTEGGPIAGTFSISDLTGCGFLTNIVSPLTKGSGNAIALNLTNR